MGASRERCDFDLQLSAHSGQMAIVLASVQPPSDSPNPPLFPKEKHASLLSSRFLGKKSLIQESTFIHGAVSQQLFCLELLFYLTIAWYFYNYYFFMVGKSPCSLSLLLIPQDSPVMAVVPHDSLLLLVLLAVKTVWRANLWSKLRYSPRVPCLGWCGHHQPRHVVSTHLGEMELCPASQEEAGRVREVINNDCLVISSAAISHTKHCLWGCYVAPDELLCLALMHCAY